MPEPASDRFHRLVYQRMMAANESQPKAWEYCSNAHKETYAAYQKEAADGEAAVSAANEAEFARKQRLAADRQSRQRSIELAVDQRMEKQLEPDYAAAFRAVEREQPGLFVGMQECAANTAQPTSKEAKLKAIGDSVAALQKYYLNGGDAYDVVKRERPEWFEGLN